MTVSATAVPSRNDCLKEVIQPGDRVEFRLYGYKWPYALGTVKDIRDTYLIAHVDGENRKARVEFDDIIQVIK